MRSSAPRLRLLPPAPPPDALARRRADDRFALACLLLVAAAIVVSGIRPVDRLTWFLEVLPAAVAAVVLGLAHRRFPLTPLVLGLLAAYSLLLCLGAHWTYAQVPFGGWARDGLSLDRNPYDRFVHFMGGVLPAPFVREVLLRRTRLRPGRKLFWIVGGLMLALGAAYELLEWAVVMAFGDDAAKFLATQGDPWDAQWDMLAVFGGALLSQALLVRAHDRQLAARGHKSGLGPGAAASRPPGAEAAVS